MKKLFISLLVIGLAVACKKNPQKPVPNVIDSMAVAQEKNKEAVKHKTDTAALRKVNDEVLQTLKSKDYKTFASYIHPEKGVRFSMYAMVDPKGDKQFSRVDFEKYLPSKTLFTWGLLDGSGDPYQATLTNYLSKWVFSKDFTASQYSVNKFHAGGNSLNNLKEIYPGDDFTENYIKGSEKNGEMDWKTIRLVWEEVQGKYYLVAVVNDQWTI
ncbi:MAG: hypothetical protein LBE92_21775 [Chryseobacterium sp.]|jgi:hypothetical protein|uniref:hypothetical protein n=1 Tax=Chryseobacterium sp. TaxID=1871047 RepID=UPI00281A2ABE|nr:hypothetical protein [Chryseobacterium sp.]MDR2238752.1 hypothetical protein [Chryseobacterium sp.]